MKVTLQVLLDRGFNPRPRTGSDYEEFNFPAFNRVVSIHAPARGATKINLEPGQARGGFNPRPRTGSDFQARDTGWRERSFNPRPRTGSDRFPCEGTTKDERFNPRPRTGSDFRC